MRKIISFALILTLSLCALCGCGDSNKEFALEGTTAELLDELLAFTEADEMVLSSEETILDNTGISNELYTERFYSSDITGLSSETLAFFVAADDESASKIEGFLNTYLSDETARQKNYNADNYAMTQKGVVAKKGLYVYLIISPKVDEIKSALEGKITQK